MKWVLRIVGLLVVLVIVAVVVVFFMLNTIVKSAVQTAGESATGVPTELAGVNISPFSGAATISEFSLGQPEGFNGEVLFALNAADVQVAPASLLGDTVQVPKVHIDGAHLTVAFENGKLNLQKLMEQIQERTGGATEGQEETPPADPDAPGKNVVIDDLRITNTTVSGSVALLPGQPPVKIENLKIADINKQGIGSDGQGLKLEDAVGLILETIMVNATQGIATNIPGLGDLENLVGDVGGQATKAIEGAGEEATKAIDDAGKKLEEGLGGLLGGLGQKKEEEAPAEE
ncbi:MAG: AsmA family protein [Planctomycetota bacterium]